MKIILDFEEKTIRFDSECKLTDIKTLQDILPDWKTWRIVPQYTMTVTPNIYYPRLFPVQTPWTCADGTFIHSPILPNQGTITLSNNSNAETTDCATCAAWGDSVGNMMS